MTPLRRPAHKSGWARRHAPPLAAFALSLLAAAAFTFGWGPLVRHHGLWLVPGDIWATLRSAHFVGWGDLGGIYGAGTGLVALPGFAILLAPVAMACGALGLSEAFPYVIPHPTAWLLVGPFSLAMNGVALAALDALAVRMGCDRRRRWGVAAAGAVVLWPATTIWGHPEDVLALALAAFGILALSSGRRAASAWLLSAAVAVQPLALLVVPAALGWVGGRRALQMAARIALFPAALVAIVLAGDPSQSWHALFDQPNFPRVDWATPWVALSPHLARGVVAAGPARLVAVAAAILAGVHVARRPRSVESLVWAAGLALSARCWFEAVMVPYYVAPAAALLVVAAWARGRGDGTAAAVVAAVLTVTSEWRLGPWPYWVVISGLLGLLCWLGRPGRPVPASAEPQEAVDSAAPPEDDAPLEALAGAKVPARRPDPAPWVLGAT